MAAHNRLHRLDAPHLMAKAQGKPGSIRMTKGDTSPNQGWQATASSRARSVGVRPLHPVMQL